MGSRAPLEPQWGPGAMPVVGSKGQIPWKLRSFRYPVIETARENVFDNEFKSKIDIYKGTSNAF